MRKRVLFVCIALIGSIVGLCGAGCSAAVFSWQTAPVKVFGENIRIADPYVAIDAAYPIVSGMKDTAFQADFNRAVQEETQALAARMRLEAQKEYGDAQTSGFPFHRHEFTALVEKHFVSDRLISIGVRMEFYTGGAHPFSDSRFYVLENTIPARRLSLPLIFTDSDVGLERLDGLVQNKIRAQPGEFFDGAAAKVDYKTWYYLTGKELHIVFPQYSVAPGCAGEPDMGFDLNLFKDVLIPEVYS